MCDVIKVIAWLCILPGFAQLKRCQGLLLLINGILSKDRSNKDSTDDILDYIEVESLVRKCEQLINKSAEPNTEERAADR